MGRGVNKVILVGHLGRDPDFRSSGSSPVANVSIATTESWKDKNSGEKQERTEWHRVVFFGKLAEIAHQYLHKGSQVYIEGRLQTRKWQDKDGTDRYTTEIVVSDMQMLGGRSGNGDNREPPNNEARTLRNDNTGPTPSVHTGGGGAFDPDDIPFACAEYRTIV